MKTFPFQLALGIAVVSLVGSGVASADPAEAVSGKKKEGTHEKLVFLTGSRIQRGQVKAIGTNTTSPIRVYTREEMDKMGRFTTEGVLAQDPSVRIIGLGFPYRS